MADPARRDQDMPTIQTDSISDSTTEAELPGSSIDLSIGNHSAYIELEDILDADDIEVTVTEVTVEVTVEEFVCAADENDEVDELAQQALIQHLANLHRNDDDYRSSLREFIDGVLDGSAEENEQTVRDLFAMDDDGAGDGTDDGTYLCRVCGRASTEKACEEGDLWQSRTLCSACPVPDFWADNTGSVRSSRRSGDTASLVNPLHIVLARPPGTVAAHEMTHTDEEAVALAVRYIEAFQSLAAIFRITSRGV